MASIAENRGDMISRFQNALFLGDVENRVQMFKEIDLYPLAYLLAKSHGLTDECQSILETTGLSEDQISLPSLGAPVPPPRTVVPTHKANWPMKAASHSSFEKALLGEVGASADEDGDPDLVDENLPAVGAEKGLTAQEDEEEEAGDGWDMGEDIVPNTAGADADFVNVDNPDAPASAGSPSSSEAEMWARNSPLAADHVAAGSFDTAMQLLNRQVGAVNFEPLKPRFLEIYQASRTFLPATTGLPPLVNYVRRNVDETDTRKVLPVIPRDLESITTNELQEGFAAMKSNKLDVGVIVFKRILQSILVNVVGSQTQVNEAKAIITKATEYALAMSVELEQRKLAASGNKDEASLKRQLELSAFFTVPRLEVPHRQLALMAALKLAFTNKQFLSALSFANRVIANGVAPKLVEQVCVSSY
jgi:coatomer protein complex subunit alpha (xenin)